MPRRKIEKLRGPSNRDWIRAFIWKYHTGIILSVLFGISAAGSFQSGIPNPWIMGVWGGGVAWVLAVLTVRYGRRAATDRRSQIEVLSLLILAANFLVQLDGGLSSSLILVYVFLVLFAAFLCDLLANSYVIGAILFLETLNVLLGPEQTMGWGGRGLVWAVGLSFIPVVVRRYLDVERREKEELKEVVVRFQTSAKAFRPLPGASGPKEILALTSDEREKQGAPFHARFDRAVGDLFLLFKGAVRQAHHCILFLPLDQEGGYHLHKAVGGEVQDFRSKCVISEGEGLIGFAVKERRSYRMGHVIPNRESLGYGSRSLAVQSIMVRPLVQNERVEGVVVVDSLQQEAFDEEDEENFMRLSQQVLEAIENLRDHQSAQSRAQELWTLMTISESLGSKLDLAHRLNTMADKVREVIPYDHCFIFLVEPGGRRAELKVVRGHVDPNLVGRTTPLQDGFLSLVAKRRTALIKLDLNERERGKGVFPTGSGIQLRPASFLGLPMIAQDHVIGIFAMTSQRPNAFDEQHKEFLKTLCSQAALSIADAKLHDEVIHLATTDGLTGISNHRRFQERLYEEVERQAREKGTFTLVMIDVDHFKRVNDRFGHPSGDAVLKQVAGVLIQTVRKIDIVARYGGEEFAVLLLNIGQRESFHLLERIRKSVEELMPEINGEPQRVTISLGMAVYPDDAHDRKALLECADRALYSAKNNGRNQTCVYSKIKVQ